MTEEKSIKNIVIMPRIQADTATAVYLLRAFGEKIFPNINNAPVLFWTAVPEGQKPQELETQGYLLVDLGGIFDHHTTNQEIGAVTECASTIIAKHLGLENHPALKKLLTWAKRDDLEGRGTISGDSIDRAFGLSGIINSLNRRYPDDPQKTLDIVLLTLDAHVREEWRRNIEYPQIWQQLLASGQAEQFIVQQGSADLNVAVVESDDSGLPGFLRAAEEVDIIIQKKPTGHINIITKQIRSIDLAPLIEAIRLAEAAKNNQTLNGDLRTSGRIALIPNWYYDTAANTIQNGGINPQNITPTLLTKDEVINLVKKNIPMGIIGRLKRQKEKDKSFREE